MATQRSRSFLEDKFEDGDRPTGTDFADLFESFINKVDDSVTMDVNNNLSVPGGITISNAVTGTNGTLRFNSATQAVEVFFGGVWNPIAGESGAFTEVNGGPNVAFNAGNVGIGTNATTPASKLEVPLTANSPVQRVRFGNVIAHNGPGTVACIAHSNRSANTDFAVRQDSNGNTTINCSTGAQITLAVAGVNRIIMDGSGNATFGGTLHANGNISSNGTITANVPSDIAVKEDIKTLPWGLEELLRLKPISFRYNGVGDTPTDGQERIGLIAQEVEAVFPSLVKRSKTTDPSAEHILSYDPQPLLYIMINAVRELAGRVEKLESQLFGNSDKA
jgi:hypothetical protein